MGWLSGQECRANGHIRQNLSEIVAHPAAAADEVGGIPARGATARQYGPMVRMLIAAGLGGVVLAGQAPPPVDALALVNATILNVADGTLQRGATIVLRGGLIESVGSGAAPAGVRAIDLRARFAMPGLIDAHTHIDTLASLQTALHSGVTTIRTAGVGHYADIGLRELVRTGTVVGPDVIASGYHVRANLAEQMFFDHPALAPLMRGAAGSDALRRVVDANLSRGVDWIKVMATERAGTPGTDPRRQMYTEDELRAVVETAAAKGVPVQAHAHGAEGAHAAVLAGVRSIEHGTYLTDETLALMRARGTYFDATLEVLKDMRDPGGDYDHRDLQLRAAHMLPRLCETIGRAHKAGVAVVAGSDSGYRATALGRVSLEVPNLAGCGLPALTAVQAATLTNARMLRREKQIGQVAAGFEADLLVVERNPLEQLSTLQDPLLVISNGRVGFDRLNFGRGTQ